MMEAVVHRADTRGFASHGWLESHHTFSFAGYFDPSRVNFGMLRVLNDDTVAPGAGFGEHPHDNMEIISIPLEGALRHADSMGNTALIRKGDVQVMSAGRGITHSEYNASQTEPVKFLQIWIFPDKRNVEPRYHQVTPDPQGRNNALQLVVSPDGEAGSAWIHQRAWFYLCRLDAGRTVSHKIHTTGNGIYIFVLSGELQADGYQLAARDGAGITKADEVTMTASRDCEFLVMEVPMTSR